MMRTAFFLLILATSFGIASAAPPQDPLQSPNWQDMAERLLSGHAIEFDERVKISVPSTVENQAQVPVTADARALPNVVKMIVFADLNPIQHALTLTPGQAAPFISFRMKIEQATPIRAAALTSDGVWHVGGIFLNAAGGGCSAPAVGRGEASWSETLGQASGRLWREADGFSRLRFRIRHPMDTGLAKDNTPAYYIERMEFKGNKGEPLALLEMYEPVSQDPTLTLLVRLPAGDTALDVQGRDNNGAIYRSSVPAPWRQSILAPTKQLLEQGPARC